MRIRKGVMLHRYAAWHGGRTRAFVKDHVSNPWQGQWAPTSEWRTVPNVLSAEINQGFDNNGIQTATLTIENVFMEEQSGLAGLFHKIRRGWFSPYRGYVAPGKPRYKDPKTGQEVISNQWYTYLARDSEIDVWMGYGGGDGLVRVFTGLVDEMDASTKPDKITVAARDFGQFLLDQRFFGIVKDKSLRDPVVFADRRGSDDLKAQARHPKASSKQANTPARFGTDLNKYTTWLCYPRRKAANTEWIEFTVPEGRYEDIHFEPKFPNHTMYVSVYVKNRRHITALDHGDHRALVDGVHTNEGWLDLGNGIVPETTYSELDDPSSPPYRGPDGGEPWVARYKSVKNKPTTRQLPFVLRCGDGTKFRISFRNLHKIKAKSALGHTLYQCGMKNCYAPRRTVKQVAIQQKWVRCDDLSDAVKIVLRWAGFQEWNIETTGISFDEDKPMIVNRQTFLIDLIKKLSELTGYIFFIEGPDEEDGEVGIGGTASIGIPHWHRPSILDWDDVDETITDSTLLTGMKVHFTDAPLPYIVYVRGKQAKKKKGGGGGRTLGGGAVAGQPSDRRVQSYYKPPWTREHRLQAIKHVLHTEPQLKSDFECKMAALGIGMQAALASVTGVIEAPLHPGLMLDGIVQVHDTGTGVNSRMYIAQRTLTFEAGANARAIMTLQGSMIDTPDIVGVLADYKTAIQQETLEEIARIRAKKNQRGRPEINRIGGGSLQGLKPY